MNSKCLIFVVSILGFTQNAFAMCTQNGNSLNGLVGLGSSGTLVYADVNSASNECGCDRFRFQSENTDIKIALSVLLSAKIADKKVRIDIKEPGNCNTATNVYLQY